LAWCLGPILGSVRQRIRQPESGTPMLTARAGLAPGVEAADPVAELLGLAARIYTAMPAERAGLADQVIACAIALGGQPG
jgi:hypothetical protein